MRKLSGDHTSALQLVVFIIVVTVTTIPFFSNSATLGMDSVEDPKPLVTPTPIPASTPTPISTPMPASTPSPTQTSEPEGDVETPTEAPTAKASSESPMPKSDSTAPDESETSSEASDGSNEEVAKGDEVTNPGDVAFTDYQPFDLDQIEPEPLKTKWDRFVAGVRGLNRYNLYDGKVKFRLGASFKIDANTGNGNEAYEQTYSSIDSGVHFRLGVIYAAGRIKDFNFSVGLLDLASDKGLGQMRSED